MLLKGGFQQPIRGHTSDLSLMAPKIQILPDIRKEAIEGERFHPVLTGSYLGTP
jgi:hypothetical protein